MTLSVVGPILKGSLVMRDNETGTLWSQLLGDCIEGELKGEQLESLPCDMVTWEAWRREHADTTVLNMSRTSRNYTNEFYDRGGRARRGGPERFCLGWMVDHDPYHCTVATLRKRPLLNLQFGAEQLVVTFDPKSTSACLFSRKLNDRVLTFVADTAGLLRDEQTGSRWNRMTGVAVAGALEGKQLDHRVGIMSFTSKWKQLHPETKEVTGETKKEPTDSKASTSAHRARRAHSK